MGQDAQEKNDSLPWKVSSGKAFLKVVAYPWGVEFDLPDGEESK